MRTRAMMTTATTNLEKAINESILRGHSIDLEWDRSMASLVDAIVSLGWHADYTDTNDPGVYDVWGWEDDTPEDYMEWRLKVTVR